MSARILRYEVPVDNRWHEITSLRPLAVGCRFRDIVEFWAWEFPNITPVTHQYKVVGTGQPIDEDVEYIDTVTAPGGRYIWHLTRRLP